MQTIRSQTQSKIRWGIASALITLVLFAVLSGVVRAQDSGPKIKLTLWDGTNHIGTLKRFSRKNGSKIVKLERNQHSQTFPLKNIIRIYFPNHTKFVPTTPINVRLRSGTRIKGEIQKSTRDGFVFTSHDLKKNTRLTFLKHGIDLIEYPLNTKNPPSSDEEDQTEDILFKADGDQYFGFIKEVTPKQAVIEESSLGTKTVPYEKIHSIDLAPTGDAPTPPKTVYVELRAQSGSRFIGKMKTIHKNTIQLKGLSGKTWKIPLSQIRSLRIKNGRTTFLSEMDPIHVVQEERFFTLPDQKEADPLSFPFRWQRNRSVPHYEHQNNPIELNGTTYQNGISCYPYTRLTFKLNDRDERFLGTIGLDDRARKPGTVPAAVFRLYVDRNASRGEENSKTFPVSSSKSIPVKKVYDSREEFTTKNGNPRPMRFSDDPQQLDISVAPHDYIILEVDYGSGYLEYASWANARLIQAP